MADTQCWLNRWIHEWMSTLHPPSLYKATVKVLGSFPWLLGQKSSFLILSSNVLWLSTTICQKIWKTQQWLQDLKRSVFIPIPKKGNAKECSNYCTIALISHASKVMLKILQTRLQQYMNREIPDVQAGFRKDRGTRDQIANIHRIIEKSKRAPEKCLLLLYWLCQSLWLCESQQTVENS